MKLEERRVLRREHVELAHQLREQGLQRKEIAARLGITIHAVHDYLHDPDGSKKRARIEGYGKRHPCVDCGAPTSGAAGLTRTAQRCSSCRKRVEREGRFWTRERIIEAIQRWARTHHGMPPFSTEWNSKGRGSGYPPTTTVLARFGSWAAAVEAAGFPRPFVGIKRAQMERLIAERAMEAPQWTPS